MRLRSKTAIVTGAASKGIGRAIAKAFLREGANVVLADINMDKLKEAKEDVSKEDDGEVSAIQVDISQEADAERMVQHAVKKHGRLDILVNNAGIIARTPFLESSPREWDRIFSVNVRGYFVCTKAAARQMKQQGSGKIIMLSSDAAFVGIPPLSAYACSKAAVYAMVRTAAIELASENININAIAPGTTQTDMTSGALSDPEWRAKVLSRFPLGRLGEPADIAGAAVFLASAESDWMTGQCIIVDGGHTSR